MSRNAESRFAINPTNIDISRSKFNRNSSVKTTFNVGQLIPFYLDEVLPGDTFNVKTSKVVRLQTMLTPMMDNLYLDTYYFFVPNRLVWEHWKQFMGENTESAWIPTTEYSIPQITAPEGGWQIGTIADYLGIPTGVGNLSVSALPFRSYALVVNEWFRDQNLCDPVNIDVGDSTAVGSNGSNYITDLVLGGKPFVAAKYHDYFTSCLPAPQKGPDVQIPVAVAGNYAVVGNGKGLAISDGVNLGYLNGSFAYNSSTNTYTYPNRPTSFPQNVGSYTGDWAYSGTSHSAIFGVPTVEELSGNLENSGLIAVAEGNAAAATINQLRLAFQIQRLYEKDARGGTRYVELLKSHFGVTSPDARQQRPEYLGGNRIPINVNQIVQQSGTGSASSTPQGTPTGLSLTTDVHGDFSKSFTEHGFVIGVMVARYDHSYQQGIERMWSRRTRFDYYWPVLANIGEQAIKNKEIYAQGSAVDDEVFGYQEAWAEYRYKPSRVCGEMRSNATASLDVWHLADDYESLPHLSAEWIREDHANVDRVLAITSKISNQLFADLYIQNETVRAMPMYSIPGLIDHH